MASLLDFVRPARSLALELVAGRGHYDRVIEAIREARRSVWVATANVKELLVEDHRAAPGRRRTAKGAAAYRSVLSVFDDLAGRGVELRLLHAGAPSGPFRAQLARLPRLAGAPAAADPKSDVGPGHRGGLEMKQCPRVHLKLVVVDGALAYLGSANFTGAGLGVKGEGRRNFELGVVSRDDQLLDEVQGLFDQIWRGAACDGCRLRSVCPAPLDGVLPSAPDPKRGSRRRGVRGKVVRIKVAP